MKKGRLHVKKKKSGGKSEAKQNNEKWKSPRTHSMTSCLQICSDTVCSDYSFCSGETVQLLWLSSCFGVCVCV